jgi:hypothetical protein
MELEDLVGKHTLTGVGSGNIKTEDEWNPIVDSFSFKLDGVVYTAIENPEDGYRSCMEKLVIDEHDIDTRIPPVEVMGKMKDDDNYYNNKTLQLIDVENGEVVLEVGTDNYNDYYPWFVREWYPKRLHINKG